MQCEAPKCGVEETPKLNKTFIKLLFLIVYIFGELSLKFSFRIKKPTLKMKDYNFSIQDFVQGYL